MAERAAGDDGGRHDHYFQEPPAILSRNVAVGVRLLAGAMVSFFGCFLFAYVYLRERDSSSAWRPAGVHVPLGTGIAVAACIVLAAVACGASLPALRRLGEARWLLAIALVQLLGLAALGVQCYQWAVLDFGPNSGAYASVFICWTGFYAGLVLPCALYWTQTALSASFRHRHHDAPGTLVAVAGMPGGEAAVRELREGYGPSLAFFWYVVAGIEIVTFALLYLAR